MDPVTEYRTIPLHGKRGSGKHALVSLEDYDRLAGQRWHLSTIGYPRTRHGPGSRTHVYMHQLVCQAPEGHHVDHVNGDKLDNRRCNLRSATQHQNMFMNAPPRRGTSRFKGVHFKRNVQKYRAAIQFAGVKRQIGYFDSEDDAAKAYDIEALRLHGEFARLNFPELRADYQESIRGILWGTAVLEAERIE